MFAGLREIGCTQKGEPSRELRDHNDERQRLRPIRDGGVTAALVLAQALSLGTRPRRVRYAATWTVTSLVTTVNATSTTRELRSAEAVLEGVCSTWV